MSLQSEKLTIDYKKIAAIPIGKRMVMVMANRGLADVLSSALTPSQRAALFPKYYPVAETKVASLGTQNFSTKSLPTGPANQYTSAPPKTPAKPVAPGQPGTPDNYEAYIRQKAASLGIDPDIAVRVAKSEGLNSYTGDSGSSFGPFQLHYGNQSSQFPHSGLGDEFTKQTGLDARDPNTWQQQVDFALEWAQKHGWNDWSGAQQQGITGMAGIDPSKATAIPTQQPPTEANASPVTATPIPNPNTVPAGDLALGITAGRKPDLTNVDPKLKEVVAAGASHLPAGYKVSVNEGYNPNGHVPGSQHHIRGKGALDVQITDPSGKVIPNEGGDPTGMYKKLAGYVKGEMIARYPNDADQLAWGGGFGASQSNSSQDLMHFDLGGGQSPKNMSRAVYKDFSMASLDVPKDATYGQVKVAEGPQGLALVPQQTASTTQTNPQTSEPSTKTTDQTYNIDQKAALQMVRNSDEFKKQAGMFAGMVSDDMILNNPQYKTGIKTAVESMGGKVNSDGSITINKSDPKFDQKKFDEFTKANPNVLIPKQVAPQQAELTTNNPNINPVTQPEVPSVVTPKVTQNPNQLVPVTPPQQQVPGTQQSAAMDTIQQKPAPNTGGMSGQLSPPSPAQNSQSADLSIGTTKPATQDKALARANWGWADISKSGLQT